MSAAFMGGSRLEYDRSLDGTVIGRVQPPEVQGLSIVFRAHRLRFERGALQARLQIEANAHRLTWDNLSVGEARERTHLGNSAHERLKAISLVAAQAYKASELKTDLDDFCHGLEPFMHTLHQADLLGAGGPEPLGWFLRPWIIEGGGTILFAPPGRGKSYLALLWAVSVNNGVNGLFPAPARRVLFINLERSWKSLERRVQGVNHVLGLPRGTTLPVLTARGKGLADIAESVRREIVERGTELVFLDSISRSGYGDLTENAPVNRAMDALNALCPSWVALAHTPRSDESHPYGSIMFDAAADVVVQLLSQQTESGLGLGLQMTKANDMPLASLFLLGLEMDGEGLRRAWKASEQDFPEITSQRRRSLEDEMAEYLVCCPSGKATATEIAQSISRNRTNVSHLGNTSRRFGRVKQGREVLFFVSDKALL